MPIFLESSTVNKFSDGDFTHRRNFLSESLTKLRNNNSNSTLNLPEENITSMHQIELKNRLNHALVRQQEIQNELSWRNKAEGDYRCCFDCRANTRDKK